MLEKIAGIRDQFDTKNCENSSHIPSPINSPCQLQLNHRATLIKMLFQMWQLTGGMTPGTRDKAFPLVQIVSSIIVNREYTGISFLSYVRYKS